MSALMSERGCKAEAPIDEGVEALAECPNKTASRPKDRQIQQLAADRDRRRASMPPRDRFCTGQDPMRTSAFPVGYPQSMIRIIALILSIVVVSTARAGETRGFAFLSAGGLGPLMRQFKAVCFGLS